MSEAVDPWAREQIGKIWSAHRELAADYWGPNRDNGRRSEIADNTRRIQVVEGEQTALRGDLRHYLDAEREETCLGLKALAEHEQHHEADAKEETDVEVAKIQAGGQIVAAKEQARGAAWREWIVLAGVVLMALKDYLGPILFGVGK
jgi:hypothetical protein